MLELSLEELAKFNGTDDSKVYLGFNGDIFDVSDVGKIFCRGSKMWISLLQSAKRVRDFRRHRLYGQLGQDESDGRIQ